MAKRSQKSSATQASNPANNPAHPSHWSVTKLLASSEHIFSNMTAEKLAEVTMLFDSNIVAIVPESSVEADWFREGWTCFHYYYPFELSMTFPFSQLVNDVASSLKISSAQLMPSAWRVLAFLGAIENNHRLGINIDVIMCCFTPKKYACPVGLLNNKEDEPLILNNRLVNDRGWGREFFLWKSPL